jgi:hypothetical protein
MQGKPVVLHQIAKLVAQKREDEDRLGSTCSVTASHSKAMYIKIFMNALQHGNLRR